MARSSTGAECSMWTVAGGTDAHGLGAKLAISIERSNAIHKSYAPADIETVRAVDEARIRGRRKMRAGNKRAVKVSPEQPTGDTFRGKPGR